MKPAAAEATMDPATLLHAWGELGGIKALGR